MPSRARWNSSASVCVVARVDLEAVRDAFVLGGLGEQVGELLVQRRAARDHRAHPEVDRAGALRVAARDVGRGRHVDDDRDVGSEPERRRARTVRARAPPAPPRRRRRRPARSLSPIRRAASSAMYAPSRLSSAFESSRPFGSSVGSPPHTPASPTRTSCSASSRLFAPMSRCRSVCSSRPPVAHLLRVEPLARDRGRECGRSRSAARSAGRAASPGRSRRPS